jgi:hypothetical protein
MYTTKIISTNTTLNLINIPSHNTYTNKEDQYGTRSNDNGFPYCKLLFYNFAVIVHVMSLMSSQFPESSEFYIIIVI